MELNKKELKIISYEFRCISSRLLRVAEAEMNSVLKLFITYIDKTSLIKNFISNCSREGFEVEREVNEVSSSYGKKIFDLGNTVEEEVITIYEILKYCLEKDIWIANMAMGYSRSRNYNEIIRDFNNRITLILINYIEEQLTKIGIKMGYDEDVNYIITVNGGQVNIAKDNSTLNAVQNNGANTDDIIQMVINIKKLLDTTIPQEEKEIIEDNIDTIQDELKKDNPKKGLIKTCVLGLKTSLSKIPNALILCKNIEQFIEYVSSKLSQTGLL